MSNKFNLEDFHACRCFVSYGQSSLISLHEVNPNNFYHFRSLSLCRSKQPQARRVFALVDWGKAVYTLFECIYFI